MLKLIKRLKSKKSGFTLIELIVVIAILGILAAILVPNILGYVNDANESTNKANARAIYSAAQAAYVSFTAGGGTVTADTYDQDDVSGGAADTFLGEVKANLGSGVDKDYTIVVGTNGVTSVTYEEETYPTSTTTTTA